MVYQIAARFRYGHPGQGRRYQLEQNQRDQKPASGARNAHQSLTDVLAADSCISTDQVGDKDALDDAAEQDEPHQAVPGPGATAYDDDRLAGADADRCDDGSRSENGHHAHQFAR